jgi:hypothetical protein
MVRASAAGGRAVPHCRATSKTSNTIYEEAKRVYERILREKAGKGYQIAQATANGDAAISG